MTEPLLDTSSAVAPPHQIMQILRMRIAKGVFGVGDLLPTDLQLMDEFGVGRHTVRTAVQSLVSQGLVKRYPGRGSYVLKPNDREENWSLQSLDDVLGSKYSDEIDLISRSLVHAGDHLSAAIALGVSGNQKITRMIMTRSMRGVPALISNVFLPRQYGDMLPKDIAEQLKEAKLISLVMKYCGVTSERLRQGMAAIPAPDWVAEALHLPQAAPVLAIRRTYFDAANCAIQVGDLYCNSALYDLNIEFRRARTPGENA